MHKTREKAKKKQDKIDKKHKSIRKDGSAKRRGIIGNRENKSCSPHNTNECPRETELNGRSTVRNYVVISVHREVFPVNGVNRKKYRNPSCIQGRGNGKIGETE